MNGFGSRMRAAPSLLHLLSGSPWRFGARAMTGCASSWSRCSSSPVSQCLSMIRQRSEWRLFVRALVLGLVVAFAFRMTSAEVHYARGWKADVAVAESMSELATAARLYPFLRRFREAPELREKVLRESGK